MLISKKISDQRILLEIKNGHFIMIVQFSHSVMSDSLRPYGLQHTRLPCPSLSPGVCLNACSLSWWCHPNISSSVVPFSSCPQSFPASESFLMSRLFASGGQSIRASASASVLPVNIQDWFPLGLIGFISLLSKGLSRVYHTFNYCWIVPGVSLLSLLKRRSHQRLE